MNQVPLNENKSTEFDSLLAESINNNKLKEGTIIKGTIAEIEDDSIIVDIGAKVEGRISKREFAFQKDQKELSIGDTIDVYLDKIGIIMGNAFFQDQKLNQKRFGVK